jgi:hypothetical protein
MSRRIKDDYGFKSFRPDFEIEYAANGSPRQALFSPLECLTLRSNGDAHEFENLFGAAFVQQKSTRMTSGLIKSR